MGRKKSIGITPKQKALLEFIQAYSHGKGYAPSQQEMANHFGWRSLGTVQDYLKILTQKGALEKRANHPRALEVNQKMMPWPSSNEEICYMPITGKIAAGKPLEAIQDIDAPKFSIPARMLPKGDFYALEVEGNSMIEDGIWHGDYIVVKKQQQADDGDTVVALLERDATVKKIYRRNGRLELRPANAQMSSLWVDESDCKIQGLVVGLYRSYR